ncbi:MAG: thioredoxin peroxidase 1 [Rickettsiaceae bacterium]|jgi:peroxiredoxin (alkyl hydroperoxide reductase subunit C)|nr:thioredoxin peroxidase 1 [Rickettsiaceae bacterium]
MTVFVGKEAYNFTSVTVMPDNSIDAKFNLKDYCAGQKCVLFFYPLDFTFVCPSEIIAFHNKLGEFASRKTKVVAVSVDSHFSHIAWKNTPVTKGGIGQVQFPIVSDLNKTISSAYNVLVEAGMALRGTFIIDEDFKLRHITVNDFPLGRNVDEAIRIIDAIDFYNECGEVCPANWRKGAEGMKQTAEGVADYLTSNADKL